MKDNETIKVLELLLDRIRAYECNNVSICEGTITSTLDLINRQKAEIENLKEQLDGETVENMRLGHEIEVLTTNNTSLCMTLANRAKVERAEAIKEFAERLKEKATTHYDWSDYVDVEYIDNLVKELTEQS